MKTIAAKLRRAASPLEPEAKRARTDGAADVAEASTNGAASEAKKTKTPHTNAQFKEDPYSFVPSDNAEIKSFVDFFNVSSGFDASTLMVRNDNGTPLRTVYRTSQSVKDIVEANDFRHIRLISCGSRALARQDANREGTYACKWRLLHESLDNMWPYLGPERIVKTTVAMLRTLVHGQYVSLTEFSDPDFQATLTALSNGSAIIEVTPGEVTASGDLPAGSVPMRMTLPIWKAPTSTQLMVDKKAKQALSMRVFGRDICVFTQKQKELPDAGPPVKLEGEDEKLEDGEGEKPAVAVDESAVDDVGTEIKAE